VRELMFSATTDVDESQGFSSLERFERVARAASLVDLAGEIGRVAHHLGFAHYLYGARVLLPSGDSLQYIYSGYPEAWMAAYHARDYIRIDPVVDHCFCRNSNVPLLWSDAVFDTPERKSLWEEARAHGVASGLSVPIRGSRGEVALFSAANPEKGPGAVEHQVHTAGTMYLLGSYVHEAIRNLVYTPERVEIHSPQLTPRETECLQWWVAGKSAWDIGQILHLSQRTVRFHLDNIKRKFGTCTKTGVIAKALQLKIAQF
jgi:LuxR family transcriptional regulator, quorum-sensing system regulator LasR